MKNDNNDLARVLLSQKLLSPEQADLVRLESVNKGQRIEEVIRAHNFVAEEQLAKAKAEILGVSYVSLAAKGISPDILNYIPEPVARRYMVLPFSFDQKTRILSVAMKDPVDISAIEFLESKSGLAIEPYLALESELSQKIEEEYSQSLTSEVTQALNESTISTKTEEDTSKSLAQTITEAPIAKIVSTILDYAVKSRASDVHIEPQEERTRVRYRIDGILHERLALPKKVHDAVSSRIKILADMKIDERRIPQDGRFSFSSGDQEVDLRVSSLPTVYGEKIVMRLLKKSGGVPTLPELGLRGTALKNLENATLRPHGIILITGPTGSGKTTTLYSILTKLNTAKVNIVTLEDPVEYQIGGVNQVQINPAAGLTFASGLRSFLRQDPNIIMVGEIRDTETTDLAIQAALTGHLVFSTLHTNNASGALPRLLDMHAEPYLVASALNAVVGQRVVRRICNFCKEEYEPPEPIVSDLKLVLGKLFPDSAQQKTSKLVLYKGKGCDECSATGYQGRIGVYEVLPIDEKVGRLVLEHASTGDIEAKAIEEGMITMKQDGYLKIIEGITTVEEVLRVAQD
ncbi:Flp pilus assembly complex ATPase component TadA [Candidatus Gottesmanbacteria bacterium]|nr:Flp pilus assembly complex ATPase component TadA [Candidatus Gottesmanbacteria bacterium]